MVSELNDLSQDKEYLLYTDLKAGDVWDNPEVAIRLLEKPKSQYFRKIIAKQLGCLNEYDYKAYPNLHNVTKTSMTLSRCADSVVAIK
jgi:hypothetical protein